MAEKSLWTIGRNSIKALPINYEQWNKENKKVVK